MPPKRELYHVKNIKWDLDGSHPEALGLPLQCVIDAGPQEVADNPQLFADTLSDHYGWCIESLDADPIPAEFPDADLERYKSMTQLNA